MMYVVAWALTQLLLFLCRFFPGFFTSCPSRKTTARMYVVHGRLGRGKSPAADLHHRKQEQIIAALVQLLRTANPVAVHHVDQILAIFAHSLREQASAENEDDRPLTPATMTLVLDLVRSLPADKVQASGLAGFLQ
jgi:hypothetical protein